MVTPFLQLQSAPPPAISILSLRIDLSIRIALFFSIDIFYNQIGLPKTDLDRKMVVNLIEAGYNHFYSDGEHEARGIGWMSSQQREVITQHTSIG
jgi:hypothetical protein